MTQSYKSINTKLSLKKFPIGDVAAYKNENERTHGGNLEKFHERPYRQDRLNSQGSDD